MAQSEFKVINFDFAWKIENFFSLFENCSSIESPHIPISALHSIFFTLAIKHGQDIVVTVQKSDDLKLKLSECDLQLSDTNELELAFDTTIQSETNEYIFKTSEELSAAFKATVLNRHLTFKCHMFFGEAIIQSENSDFDALDLLKLFRDIRKLNGCEEFCDIKLQVKDYIYNVHRAILSARAPRLLKKSALIIDASNINHVTSITSPVFKLLMKYIYCEKLDTPNVQLPSGLLKVVDKLKMDNLKRKVSVYPNQIKVETRQSCSKTSFTWSVENISSMKFQSPKRVKFTPVFQSSYGNICQSEMNLEVVKLAEGSEEDIYFNVSLRYCFDNSSTVYFVKTKTSILDIFGELNCSQEYQFQVDKSKLQSEISTWVYRISKNDLDLEEEVFLQKDTLTFVFDLNIYRADFNIEGCAYAEDSFPDLSFDMEDRCQLSLDLEALYNTKEYSDLIFTAGGKPFNVHKIVLFARAPKLLNALSSASRPREIIDCDPNVMEDLIRYLYTAKLPEMSSGLAIKLYLIAYTYEISLLKQRCFTFVKNNLVF